MEIKSNKSRMIQDLINDISALDCSSIKDISMKLNLISSYECNTIEDVIKLIRMINVLLENFNKNHLNTSILIDFKNELKSILNEIYRRL